MTKLALFGAGGKMGVRLSANLVDSEFEVRHVEVSDEGRNRLKAELGLECVSEGKALADAEVVVLAVPDERIGKVAHSIIGKLQPGAMLVCLDAAAPFAGHLPDRADVTYFVTHPCHPPIFNDETELSAKRDYFGGVAAKQSIVCALMQGPETDYALGDKVGQTIFAPVARSYRISVEQMAILEPGLSETVCASLLVVMREAMDEVVSKGVPADAAKDFLLGHMNILSAVIFDEIDGVFSDACNKAIEYGKPMLMRDDWKQVLEMHNIAESIDRIT